MRGARSQCRAAQSEAKCDLEVKFTTVLESMDMGHSKGPSGLRDAAMRCMRRYYQDLTNVMPLSFLGLKNLTIQKDRQRT